MNDSDIVEVMAIGTCTSQEHWDGLDEIHRNMRRDLVRGVPAALRAHGLEVVLVEPTEAMIEAGYEAPDHIALARRVVRNIYRAMITAANPTAGK